MKKKASLPGWERRLDSRSLAVDKIAIAAGTRGSSEGPQGVNTRDEITMNANRRGGSSSWVHRELSVISFYFKCLLHAFSIDRILAVKSVYRCSGCR